MVKHLRHLVYAAGFLISFHLALPAYVSSSFLAAVTSSLNHSRLVGGIFFLAAAAALGGIATIDRPIKRFGLRATTVSLSAAVALLGLALWLSTNPWLSVILFIAFYASGLVIKFLLDIYLEDLSTNGATGRIRGLFLTLTNLAWLASPIIASRLINEIYFERVYLLAAAILLPFIYLIALPLKHIPEPQYAHHSFFTSLKLLSGRGELAIKQSIWLSLILDLFYAFMVIYLPLYLNLHL